MCNSFFFPAFENVSAIVNDILLVEEYFYELVAHF